MTRATSDGHTGRAARNAALRRLRRASERKATRDQRQLAIDSVSAPPAGSPEVTCRSPLQGGGGGCSDAGAHAAGLLASAGPFLRSYSETNCSECPDPSDATTGDQTTPPPGTDAPGGPGRTYGVGDRVAWDAAVAEETREFRQHQASKHRAAARAAALIGDSGRRDWHLRRADGQDERPQRVAACGTEEVRIRCNDCAHEMTQLVLRCQQWRLCRQCRAVRAAQRRSMFRDGRRAALGMHKHLLHRSPFDGGRFGDRFISLTLTHSGDIQRDIRALPRLWRRFRAYATKHMRVDLGAPRDSAAFPFVRVIEVTAGDDGLGHAHIHGWLLSPYFPHALMRLWWGRALMAEGYPVRLESLEAALATAEEPWQRRRLDRWLVTRRGPNGRPLPEVPWPVADIRKCRHGIEREFIKYLVKDAERTPDGSLKFIDPALYGRIYEGLEGIRTIQASTGFWSKDSLETGVRACQRCGQTNLSSQKVRRKTTDGGDAGDA